MTEDPDSNARLIAASSSWDEGTATAHQSTGQDTTSGEPISDATSSQQHHKKVQSWSGVLAEFATDLFGDATGSSPAGSKSRPPLPRPEPVQRRSSGSGGEYALRNQTFLKQAAAGALNASKSPAVTTTKSSNNNHLETPNTKFRKRLHLKAIEEADDGQSFVVMDRSGHSIHRSSPISIKTPNASSVPSPPPPPYPTWFSATSADEGDCSIRFVNNNNENPDDLSVLSSLAGDYKDAPTFPAGPTSGITADLNATGADSEQIMARFEQEQEEHFQHTKQEMERRLAAVLEQNAITKESDRTALIDSYMQEMERERAAMLAEWKAEMVREEERMRRQGSWQRLVEDCYDVVLRPCMESILSFLDGVLVVLSNMPLTIGALGLSWVTMGVVWFKFMEEMVDTCHHVHYFSEACAFREFPGCFQCDVDNPYYKVALQFHWLCSSVSALACVLFIAKVILAPNVVLDMLQNPTTSTPAGVWCIAMVCTFAGQHGLFGEIIVIVVSCFHVILAFWFLYTSIFRFRGLPDPGWFPNVVGISYAAVKTFIYFPTTGLILMTLCTVFFLCTFFVSVVRVALNHKIAAPLCWIQLSAPSITLYALTLVSQPTRSEEALFETSNEAKHQYDQFLINYFMPIQHFFMFLTMVGLASAVHSLWVRWPTVKDRPFSPAMVAFCFPTLSHTNSIQAYRASLIAFAPNMPPGSPFKKFLFGYWCFFLVVGTVLNIVFTFKYCVRLPEWTRPDLTGEEEPPAPSDTLVHEMMMDETGAHETMRQPFVSPAVMEASEAGVLVRVRRGTADYRLHGPFVRTRKISSVGFEFMLSEMELREERARLLEYVAKHAPRQRNRTLSVPGVFHLRGDDGRGVYGTFAEADTGARGHARSKTTAGTSFV